MKKLIMFALAGVLAFGSAVPAFAVGPHHRTSQCLDYTEMCHQLAQSVIAPGLQSMNERLSALLGICALPLDSRMQDSGAQNGDRQIDTYATSPSLCANGACEMYLDADHDGICDYHGADCPNLGNNAGNNGVTNSDNGASGGAHHSSAHHGGWHH